MARTARQKLAELLRDDPTLVAELRSMLDDDEAPAEERETVFDGITTEVPSASQTGKSLKYEATIAADPDDDESPKAIVIAYLPPEVATEDLHITVVASGHAPTEVKQRSGNRRKKAS